MLSEQRVNTILDIVNRKGTVTNAELMAGLDASESTIRRDISELHELGKLKKVRGGAVSLKSNDLITADADINIRMNQHIEEKIQIAKYAASLIGDNEFVFIDAGTSTEIMIDYIDCQNTSFVTNGIEHAKKLSQRGHEVFLLGGEYKAVTDAIVGDEAVYSLHKYNFTKGFFGANGFTIKNGFTTPDIRESIVKKTALDSTKDPFFLMDSSKFGVISSVSFANSDAGIIITEYIPDGYQDEYYIAKAK